MSFNKLKNNLMINLILIKKKIPEIKVKKLLFSTTKNFVVKIHF